LSLIQARFEKLLAASVDPTRFFFAQRVLGWRHEQAESIQDGHGSNTSASDASEHLDLGAAASVWGWALALLATRESLVELYLVIASAPPKLWGFLILPVRNW
jgi:hypothetical protein